MKVLFIYPRDNAIGQIPIGLSLLCACLRRAGHNVKVFDTTFFHQRDLRKTYEALGILKKADLETHGVFYSDEDSEKALLKAAQEFSPDLIGLSAVTYSFHSGIRLIKKLRREGIKTPVIVGGTHASVAPEEVIGNEYVDMVCVGEGEDAMVELCSLLEGGHEPIRVRNIWYKDKNGHIYRNPVRSLVNLDTLPPPEWSYFSDMHFPKPFVGKIYRTGHIEISRGCPYRCTYCVNAYLQDLYGGKGRYHREKSIETIIRQLSFLKKKYKLEMIRFWDETFLFMDDERLAELSDIYKKEINLPFMVSTRPETISGKNVKLLKEMGVVAISIGIESGSERIRKEILNRKVSNKKIIEAFRTVKEAGIRVTAFNMVGIPTETRADIFKTVYLNRKVRPDTSTANFLYPYPGTAIRSFCLERSFLSEPVPPADHNLKSVLCLPGIRKDKLAGLQRMFGFYTHLPRVFFPLIRLCEKENSYSQRLVPLLKKFRI